ncbi:MAG: formimidoylglutamase [Rhodothermaceae bacterium]|nr:formimidoylglutamase [Rhodothermaceae bacterium]
MHFPDDPRCGHFISRPTESPEHVLIGFGSDEGVRRNGGRPGAAEAPDLIRTALYKLTPDPTQFSAHVSTLVNTIDAGNIECTGRLEEDQEALGLEVGRWLKQGVRPIILGGGHETAYGHFLGYVEANCPVHIMNIDAHADVRLLKNGQAHSGSPFRQALEHDSGLCNHYSVYGLARWSTAKAHLDYLEKSKASYCWDHEVTRKTFDHAFDVLQHSAMLTLDVDAVSAHEAPGVSAPAVYGLPLDTVLHGCFLAGQSAKVRSFDIVEVNPRFDLDHRTVKSAALCAWHFLAGASQR